MHIYVEFVVYVFKLVCPFKCIRTCMCVWVTVYVYDHVLDGVHAYVYVLVHGCLLVCCCVCVQVCVCVHVYVYVYVFALEVTSLEGLVMLRVLPCSGSRGRWHGAVVQRIQARSDAALLPGAGANQLPRHRPRRPADGCRHPILAQQDRDAQIRQPSV